jgi:hypothetical protein
VAKYAARNTVWGRATASNFTTVATINNVKEVTPGVGSARGEFDQSTFGDEWMDFGVGQKEGDEFTMRLAYDPIDATHVLLLADYNTPAANTWIRASNATADWRWNITTVLKGWRPVHDRTGNIEAELTFRIVSPGVAEETIP